MTVINRRHERLTFPRSPMPELWAFLSEHYAGCDPRHWKYLAMLCLHENLGWSLDQLGAAFGHPKGHVSRCLQTVKRELRSRFEMPPGLLTDDDGFSDPDVPA